MDGKSDGNDAGNDQSTSLKATRLSFRRSFESSSQKDLSNISNKKSRRSCGRRKSLVEVLHSVHNFSTTVGDTSNGNVEVSEKQSDNDVQLSKAPEVLNNHTSTNAGSEKIVAQPLTQCLDDLPHTKFVLEFNQALTKELQDWKSLHEEYKLKEKEANASHLIASEMQSLIDQQPCSSDVFQKNYSTYKKKFTELEQRHFIAVRSIKASLKQIKNIRMRQENWFDHKVETEIQEIQQDSDSRILFEKICTYNDLLLSISLKKSCTV